MTREERQEAIAQLERISRNLASIGETVDYTNLAIEALEQEPISETDIILTREEYGELVSSEFDNGYAKGFREALEQEPILDKIRAEIEQTTSRYCISRERGGSGQVEWSDRLIKESEVLEIIDKYKAESEE